MKKKEIEKLILKTIKELKEKEDKKGKIKIEINNINIILLEIICAKKIKEYCYIPNNERELMLIERALNLYKEQLKLKMEEL